jgi:EmrB/QacA subfamily drug resistance transporter
MTNNVLVPDPAGHPRRWLILFVLLAAECMDLLDATIVNVAAPSIHEDLGGGLSALQWIAGGYALAIAVGLITGARLGDRHGRRRLFVIGMAGFTASSALCAAAASTDMLIVSRLLQGLFAAALIPQGFGIMRAVFPAEELQKAFAVFGPVMGGAAVLGPILGGVLVDADLAGSGWRLVFLINVPLGIAGLVGAVRVMPEIRPAVAPRLDLGGAVLAGIASGLLVYPLIQGRELGWPAWTFAMMGASAVVLAAFVLLERRRERAGADPLITPSLLTKRGYTSGIAVATIFFCAMGGLLLAITLYLQLGHGFSPLHAGLTLVPFSLGMATGAGVGGAALGPRFGRVVLQGGALLMLAGVGWLYAAVHAAGAGVTTWDLAPATAVAGLGMGLLVAPMFDIVLGGVEEHEVGSASGVLNTLQQLGGAVGIAVLGTVFFSVATHHGFAEAMQRTLLVDAGLIVGMLALSPLMPRWAREDPTVTAAVAAAPAGG